MMETLNKRFTSIADAVSEALGKWWFSILSLIALAIWILYGIYGIGGNGWFTSNSWNFPLNTLTTVGEWFIGALVAAAANRVESRNKVLQESQVLILKHIESLADSENEEIKRMEEDVKQDKNIQMLLDHLNAQEAERMKQTNMIIDLLHNIAAQYKEETRGQAHG